MTAKQQWLVVLGIVVALAGGAFAASHFLEDELTSAAQDGQWRGGPGQGRSGVAAGGREQGARGGTARGGAEAV